MSWSHMEPKSPRRIVRVSSTNACQRLLSTFGAVEIRGTKWCGKSWAALAFGESVVHLDDPNVKALAEADPALALQGALPSRR